MPVSSCPHPSALVDLEVYHAVIFDCDGTLAATMDLHYTAWCDAVRACGANFTFERDLFNSLGGMSPEQTVAWLNRHFATTLDALQVSRHHSSFVDNHAEPVQAIPHTAKFARQIQVTHRLAVASGGHRRHVQRTLQQIALDHLFQVVATLDDVEHAKPAPDLFLLAAKQLGVEPKHCLVLEDSPTGAEAAFRAGMDCIGVTSCGFVPADQLAFPPIVQSI